MTRESRWNPLRDTSELKRLHSKKFTDYAIAELMGYSVGTIRERLLLMGLRTNNPPQKPAAQPPQAQAEKQTTIPAEKSNPLTVAHIWLGRRLIEKASGYWLDGRPVHLDTIMQETNKVLKANACEQVGIERWRV